MIINISPTISGGTATTLTPAGLSAGNKASYTAPTHTRLEPRLVDFLVQAPSPQKNGVPGVGRNALKVNFASRTAEEGCCSVSAGSIIVDISVRWPLDQPEALLDSALEYAATLIRTDAFKDGAKKGTLPSS
jgi:hypothetical protein